jgi:hypothetical protein
MTKIWLDWGDLFTYFHMTNVWLSWGDFFTLFYDILYVYMFLSSCDRSNQCIYMFVDNDWITEWRRSLFDN